MTPFLKDAPAGRQFINRCVKAAADLSLAFAGEPADRVADHLKNTRRRLRRQLTPMLGKDNARLVADAFVKTVMRRKADIEALGNTGHAQ